MFKTAFILLFITNVFSLKVFIIAGQSNMQGHGKISGGNGTLQSLADKSAEVDKKVRNSNGSWKEREDVWHYYQDRDIVGSLKAGQGVNPDKMGPEVGFGIALGDYYEDQVLLIKCAWGGAALWIQSDNNSFHPPSSGGTLGDRYIQTLEEVDEVLSNLKEYFPSYDGKGYEIVGVGWHQGWNDGRGQAPHDNLPTDLSNLIRDWREEWKSPNMLWVIGESGFGGDPVTDLSVKNYVNLHDIIVPQQREVAAMPEWNGSVLSVETWSIWNNRGPMPSNQGYHWFESGDLMWKIGDKMGKAMVELLGDVPEGIKGCMDDAYEEYNENATINDESMCKTPRVVSINERNIAEALNVKGSVIKVFLNGTYILKIFDILGKELFRGSHTSPRTFSIAQLPTSDIYFVQLLAQNTSHIFKVVPHLQMQAVH